MRSPRFDLGDEALSPWSGSECASDGVREWRLEYSSRGDRVPARVLVPDQGSGPFPLVVMGHGLRGEKNAPYVDATALPWVRGGAAVAVIDFPLHGDRASAKLSERVAELDRLDEGLWIDLVEQAVVDLRRLVRALDAHDAIDGERIGYAGFSLGSILGAIFCAEEPRVRAAALAIGGAGLGPASVDPAGWIGRIAPRPVLFLQAERDQTIPREAALALHAAAGDPHEVHWVDATHSELPGAALKTMWTFLRGPLGLG